MSTPVPLVLEQAHTGERLEILRRRRDGEEWLEVRGYLPPHQPGLPLHIHLQEVEEVTVVHGTLSALKEGKTLKLGPGETLRLPRGSDHRWWNQGDEPLEFRAVVAPAVDLDRYLQAVFQVMNAGPRGKPPLFYMAHVTLRHRGTQETKLLPGMIHGPFWWTLRILGGLLGRYRGQDWPGAPEGCPGAPVVEERPGAHGAAGKE